MKKYFSILILILGIFISPATMAAPEIISYQGSMYVDGDAFTGTGYFKAAIIDSDGNTVWSNDSTSSGGSEPVSEIEATVTNGLYTLFLGNASTDELPSSLFNTSQTLYLRIWFDDGQHGFSKFSPDIRITSGVYSLNSQTLQGYEASDFILQSSQIGPSQIQSEAIDSSHIEDGAVTTSKLQMFSNSGKTFTLGNSSDSTVSIVANLGSASPALRYNTQTDQWELSNDGTTFSAIQSGSAAGDITSVIAGTGLSGGGFSDSVSLSVNQAFTPTWTGAHIFQTDVDLQFQSTENLSITHDLAGSTSAVSMVGTPSATNALTKGIFVQQANSANTNGLDMAISIDNADTDLALATVLSITNSGGGGYTNFIDTPSIDISGTGGITGATGIVSSGTITFSTLASCNSVVTDAQGVLACGSDTVAGGDITDVTAGSGLTGGATSGNATVNIGDGTGINVTADAIAVATTEIGTTTWGSADATWTFDATAGTDPTIAWTNGALDIDAVVTLDDIACEVGGCISATELGTDSVASDEIATDAVGAAEIAANAVDSSEIATNAVAADEIATGAVGTAELEDNAVAAGDLAATLTFSDSDLINLSAVNASSATEGLILPQATSVTSSSAEGQISWDSDNDTLYVGNGTTVTAVSNPFGIAIDGSDITNDTITADDIATSAVGSFEINNESILSEDIGVGSVETADILDNTITATDLNATLSFADNDLVTFSSMTPSTNAEGLILPQGADVSSATAEGQIAWDADGDILYVGNGTSATAVSNPFGSAIDSSEITEGTIAVGDIGSNAVDSDEIAANAVGTSEIADTSIAGGDLSTSIAITSTGAQNYANSSGFNLPYGEAPTVDANGEIGVDSTNNQVVFYSSGGEKTLSFKSSKSLVIEEPSDDDRLILWRADSEITILSIHCIVDPADAAESAVIALYESDGSGDFTSLASNGIDGSTTITCDNDGAADDGTLSNPTVDAGDWVGIDVGTITGTVSSVTVTYTYSYDRK